MVRLTVHAGPCSSYHFTYPTAILCGVWLGRRISLSHTPASSATSACLVLSSLKDWGQKNSYSRATAMRSSPKVVWRDSILQRHKGVIWGVWLIAHVWVWPKWRISPIKSLHCDNVRLSEEKMADYYDRGYPGGGGGGGYPGGEPSYLSELLSRDEELVGGIFYQCLAAIICSITPPTFLNV